MEKEFELYYSKDAEPLVIKDFKYTASRMGSAPTISATYTDIVCYDDKIDTSAYVEFNGEKFYLSSPPTSIYDNKAVTYKHTFNFISERSVLSATYFYDAIPYQDDKHNYGDTKSLTFSFYANITDMASRLNVFFVASGMNYRVIVDDEYKDSESKEFSIDKSYVADVLNSMFSAFGVPYYYTKGANGDTEIHFGEYRYMREEPLSYGCDNALISIQSKNLNSEIYNKITAEGSDRNIPYFYPNPTPKGTLKASPAPSLGGSDYDYVVEDQLRFSNTCPLNTNIEYIKGSAFINDINFYPTEADLTWTSFQDGKFNVTEDGSDFMLIKVELLPGWRGSEDEIYPEISIKISMSCNDAEGNTSYISDSNIVKHIEYANSNLVYNPNNVSSDEDGLIIDNGTIMSTQMVTIFIDKGYMLDISGGNQVDVSINLIHYYDSTQTSSWTTPSVDIANMLDFNIRGTAEIVVEKKGWFYLDGPISISYGDGTEGGSFVIDSTLTKLFLNGTIVDVYPFLGGESSSIVGSLRGINLGFLDKGQYWVAINLDNVERKYYNQVVNVSRTNRDDFALTVRPYWEALNGKKILKDYIGIRKIDKRGNTSELVNGDTLIQTQEKRIAVSNVLMPPKYRNTDGKDRFYIASNPDLNYFWENPYTSETARETIYTNEDLYPTISNVTNAAGQSINSFIDIAYNADDSDDTSIGDGGSSKEFEQPYFFVKLPKTDGENGFNLFDRASEYGDMTISMSDGPCAGCNFTIMVSDTGSNTVQVRRNENGDLVLMTNERGNVVFGSAQDEQNDTSKYEVWVALKKDVETYGVLMPNVANNVKPKPGDKFVILNISLPDAFITAAEQKLETEMLNYLHDNNSWVSGLSVKASSIFLEEQRLLDSINEGCKVKVRDFKTGNEREFFVSSITYTVKQTSILPELTMELDSALNINDSWVKKIGEIRRNVRDVENYVKASEDLLISKIDLKFAGLKSDTEKTLSAVKAAPIQSSEAKLSDNVTITYTTTDGNAISWQNGEENVSQQHVSSHLFFRGKGTVTLTSGVDGIPDGLFGYQAKLKTVEIGGKCSFIGDNTFAYCRSLTSVIIPDSVTKVGSSAFVYCRGLTSITIPNSVTTIGDSAFENCGSVKHINLGSGIEHIGEKAFKGHSATEINIPSTVKSISYHAFWPSGSVSELKVNSAAIFPPTAIPFSTSPTALNPWNAFGVYSDGTLTVSINATREYKNAKYWDYYSNKVTINGSKFDTVKLAQITLNSASKIDGDVVSNVSKDSKNYLIIDNGSISAVVGDYNAAEGTGLASVEGTKSYVEGRIPDIISGNEKYISVSGVMTEDGNNECKIIPNMAESNQYYKKDGLVSLSLSDSIYMSSDATSPHEVEETFTRRAFDGGLTGTDSSATIHKIVGKTVKYNQIADREAGQSASVNVYDDYNNVIGKIVAGFDTETSEYTLTYSGGKGGKLKSTWRNLSISSIRLKPSHKYAISTDRPYYGVEIVEYNSKDGSSIYHELNAIFTAKGSASIDDGCNVYLALRNSFSVQDEFGTGENLVIRLRINLFDLTEMFGDGAEPGSFAEFRTMYPKPYYQPCIDPIITGVNIKSISIPRYNLFDSNSAVTGVFRYDTGYFKCTPGWENLFCSYIIPVKANIKYSLHNVANRSQVPACVFFDKDMRQLKDSNGKAANNISYGGPQDLNADNTTASGVITTPDGCHFMAIMTRINEKDKACVSVFSSRNGSYEAFNPITIDLGVVKNHFPYGLLEKGGVFDEVCDGYAIRRINYDEYEDNGVSRISNLRPGGFTINGQEGKAFQYIPLDHQIGMSWRIKRGGTESIDLDDVSAPFNGNIVYSIESYNSLPKPQRILDSDGFLLLGSKVKDETFLSTKLISPIWHTIPNQEDQYIPTSDQVYSAILNMMPTVAAEAMPRKTQDEISSNIDNLSLIANTMIEFPLTIAKTINIGGFDKPAAMGDWNNLDNEWCIRFGCNNKLKTIVDFKDDITVRWKDGSKPTMNAEWGIMELRFRRMHGTAEEYIGSWSRYY